MGGFPDIRDAEPCVLTEDLRPSSEMKLVVPGSPEIAELPRIQFDPGSCLSSHLEAEKKERNRRSDYVHVTSLVKGPGYRCDRFLYYDYQAVEFSDPSQFSTALSKRFEMGHAFHDYVQRVFPLALKRWDSLNPKSPARPARVWFEAKIPLSRRLTGSMDILVEWRQRDGNLSWLSVYDIKTETRKAFENRTAKGKTAVPAEYVDQLQMYAESVQALEASVLWIIIDFPYPMYTSRVPLDPTPYANAQRRLQRVSDALYNAVDVLPNVGKHCSSCPYMTLCQDDHADAHQVLDDLQSLALSAKEVEIENRRKKTPPSPKDLSDAAHERAVESETGMKEIGAPTKLPEGAVLGEPTREDPVQKKKELIWR